MSRRYAPLRRQDVDRAFREAGEKVRRERLRHEHCEANSRRGTGTGMCGALLDEHGQCPRAGEHL